MATSAVAFRGLLTLNSSLNQGEAEMLFRPPSNISGKLCYVDCKSFVLNWDDLYTTPQTHHAFLLSSSWAQPQSANVEYTQITPIKIDTKATGTYATTTASGAYVSSLSATTTSGQPTLTMTDTTGLYTGMIVSGTGIPSGATISSISANVSVTLSANATASGTITPVFRGTKLTVASATGIEVGHAVSGTGIPSNTTVTAVSGTTITISSAVTANTSGNIVFADYTIVVTSAFAIEVGSSVSGTGIASGTVVTGVSGTTITLSKPITAALSSSEVSFLESDSSLTQRPSAPLSQLTYGSMQSASVPVLVHIPDGPHTVRFRVARSDSNIIAASTSDVNISLLMSIVPANGRAAPF